MPAPSLPQTALPFHRTPGVRMAFGFGLVLGFLLASGILFTIFKCWVTGEGGEGRNRADVVGANGDGGGNVVSATSCDVSRALAGMADASGPVRFRVALVRVVDGDTIRVLWHGEDIPVRLLGIDAPECNHPGGKEATECLRGLLVGTETVDLEFDTNHPRRDSLGRLLAYVWRGRTLLNLEMIQRGHAGLHRKGGKGKYADAFARAASGQ